MGLRAVGPESLQLLHVLYPSLPFLFPATPSLDVSTTTAATAIIATKISATATTKISATATMPSLHFVTGNPDSTTRSLVIIVISAMVTGILVLSLSVLIVVIFLYRSKIAPASQRDEQCKPDPMIAEAPTQHPNTV